MTVTYEDYQNLYGGTLIPSSKFTPYQIKANNYMQQITNNQVDATGYETLMKLAICAVADVEYRNEGIEGITSENVSGASRSYDINEIKKARKNAAKLYLGQTGLLYMGV